MRSVLSRDKGQAFPVYVVAVAGLLFLAFAFFAVGQAADKRSGAQSAADAAALAAAKDARADLAGGWLERIGDPGAWKDWLGGKKPGTDFHCEAAESFAASNDATVLSCEREMLPEYSYTVEVETNGTVGKSVVPGTDEKKATATATAVIEPRCDFEADKGEDKGPIELDCDGELWDIDPKDPGSVLPDASDLFSVRLSESD